MAEEIDRMLLTHEEAQEELLVTTLIKYFHRQQISVELIKKVLRVTYDQINRYRDTEIFR